jgi:hypothetical protein
MKRKRSQKERMFAGGVIFVGTGVVFLTTLNKGVGIGFLVLGILFMINGKRRSLNGKKKVKT